MTRLPIRYNSALRFGLIACLLASVALFRPFPASGQPADESVQALTVRDAVRAALESSPTLRAARHDRRAAAASVREAQAAWLPAARADVQYRRLSDNVDYTVNLPSLSGGPDESVTFAPAILNRYGVRASVDQPLFTGLRVPNRIRATRADAGAADARVQATETDVVFEARQAYWNLYEARAQQDAATLALRQIERRLQDVKNRESAGLATETDVLRVRSRRDRLRVAAIEAQTVVAAARRTLNDRMGRPLESAVQLADTVDAAAGLPERTDALRRAERQRGDVRALQETVAARQARIRVAQSEWFPSIFLTGTYVYARPNDQLFPPEDRFQGTWEAGVSLSWRLSAGTRPGVERAQARTNQSRQRLQQRRRAVRLEVRNLMQRVEQARRAVAAASTSLESAAAAYRSAQTRYDAGLSILSDLLDAERGLRAARADLASTQAGYAIARAALDRALGEGLPGGVEP